MVFEIFLCPIKSRFPITPVKQTTHLVKTTVSIPSIKKELFKFINKNAINNYVFKIEVIGNILFVFKREHSNKCFTTVIPEVHFVLQSRRSTWYLEAIY